MSTPLPKLSYVLLSHNREKYIRAAIESAFAQDYEGELEYIFSDDCSTDRTFEIIKECVAEYKGNRRVVVTQTPRNLHLAGNTNHAVQFVESDWIVRADDDDISSIDRCTLVGNAIAKNPGCSYVFTRMKKFTCEEQARIQNEMYSHRTDAEIHRMNVLQGQDDMWKKFSESNVLHQVWSAKHFDVFGKLPEDGYWVDDVISNIRCCALGYGIQIDKTTAFIRWDVGNMSQGAPDGSKTFGAIMRLERFNDNYLNQTYEPLSQTINQVKAYLEEQKINAPEFIRSLTQDLYKRQLLRTFWRNGIMNRIRISRKLGYRGFYSALRCLPLPIFAIIISFLRKFK